MGCQMGRKSRNIELDWDVQKKKLGMKQKKGGGRKRWEESVEREECYLGEQKQRAKRKGPPGTFVVIFHVFSYF